MHVESGESYGSYTGDDATSNATLCEAQVVSDVSEEGYVSGSSVPIAMGAPSTSVKDRIYTTIDYHKYKLIDAQFDGIREFGSLKLLTDYAGNLLSQSVFDFPMGNWIATLNLKTKQVSLILGGTNKTARITLSESGQIVGSTGWTNAENTIKLDLDSKNTGELAGSVALINFPRNGYLVNGKLACGGDGQRGGDIAVAKGKNKLTVDVTKEKLEAGAVVEMGRTKLSVTVDKDGELDGDSSISYDTEDKKISGHVKLGTTREGSLSISDGQALPAYIFKADVKGATASTLRAKMGTNPAIDVTVNEKGQFKTGSAVTFDSGKVSGNVKLDTKTANFKAEDTGYKFSMDIADGAG